MSTQMTLMLDEAQAPVGLLRVQDAVARLAESLMAEDGLVQTIAADETRRFRSMHLDVAAPVILMDATIDARVLYAKVMPHDSARVTRRVLFARDRYSCQYCEFVAESRRAVTQLTVDHVKPAHLFASRIEATTWDNVVAACRSCNARKGGRLPMQASMMPRCTPKQPSFVQLRYAGRVNAQQRDYVLDYFGYDPREVTL